MTDLTRLPIPIVHGPGTIAELGPLAAHENGTRALIVTDKGIEEAGHVDRARSSLEASGIAVAVFSDVHENPTTDDIASCVTAAKAHDADLLVGLGGGSSMDAAKGCNFILTNGGRMEDYWGLDKATKPMLPFIAIPTTAGTGSECQRFALISQAETHAKMACGDPKAAARVAILDPELTVTQPRFVTACTGMDAIAHAVECAVTNAATETSLTYAHEAFRLLDAHFETVLTDPSNLEARAAMQVGAALAGTAIEHSMLGSAHSAANPLTAHFDVVHGQAVGIMLPGIVRFNRHDPDTAERYLALGDDLPERLERHLKAAGLTEKLSHWKVEESHLAQLAEEAAGQWTARFNPREMSAEDFVERYMEVLS